MAPDAAGGEGEPEGRLRGRHRPESRGAGGAPPAPWARQSWSRDGGGSGGRPELTS